MATDPDVVVVGRTLRIPGTAALGAVAANSYMAITIGLISGRFVEFSAFPRIPRDDITLNLTMSTGTTENVTDSLLSEMETRVWQINEELKKERKDGRILPQCQNQRDDRAHHPEPNHTSLGEYLLFRSSGPSEHDPERHAHRQEQR